MSFKDARHIFSNIDLFKNFDQELETWDKFKPLKISRSGARTLIPPISLKNGFDDMDPEISGSLEL